MIDSCREASPDGEAEGHSDHRSQSGCSPRSLVEKGRRNGIIGAPGEMGDEIDALRVDGAARADFTGGVGPAPAWEPPFTMR